VNEAERKRRRALESAGPFVTDDPADVRWLLCGRGRPVAAGTSPYLVEVGESGSSVWYQDIERSRVVAEEDWEALGYEPRPYPWHEPPPVRSTSPDLATLRRALEREEFARYRSAGADAASALVDSLAHLSPVRTECETGGIVAGKLFSLGFTTPVVLVGGELHAPVYRHPLPLEEPVGRFALIAFTAERDGLYVSLTRVVSFGPAPAALAERVEAAAAVDAAVLAASRPGRTLGELFTVLQNEYAAQRSPDEWRLHHQGGITGYAGREVFATPGDPTVLPDACAVAWNPSFTGGGKSEDTALVTAEGIEVITVTQELPVLANGRPGIVEL
jgi:Xaa-Pro aminopeptidase